MCLVLNYSQAILILTGHLHLPWVTYVSRGVIGSFMCECFRCVFPTLAIADTTAGSFLSARYSKKINTKKEG